MPPRHFVLQVVIGLATATAVALVFEALKQRRERAATELPEPLAPGHDSA